MRSKHRLVQQRQYTRKEKTERLGRFVKRELVRQGLIPNPADQPPKWEFHWKLGNNLGGIVRANTSGEGRSLIKRELGLAKSQTLPSTIEIVRVDPNASERSSPGTYQIGTVEG